jgi:hypothetical protein
MLNKEYTVLSITLNSGHISHMGHNCIVQKRVDLNEAFTVIKLCSHNNRTLIFQCSNPASALGVC